MMHEMLVLKDDYEAREIAMMKGAQTLKDHSLYLKKYIVDIEDEKCEMKTVISNLRVELKVKVFEHLKEVEEMKRYADSLLSSIKVLQREKD
jgi:hypothetical protein